LGSSFFFAHHRVGGDKKGALAKLEDVSAKGVFRATDAKVVMALLEAVEGRPQRAISLFHSMRKSHPRNFMYDISLALGVSGSRKGSKSAIRVYEELFERLPNRSPGIQPVRFT